MIPRLIALFSVGLAAALSTTTATASPHLVRATQASCQPVVTGSQVRYCGPATAKISVFPGVTFRNGTCTAKRSNGVETLTVILGTGTGDRVNNNGQPFFILNITGPFARRVSGGLSAYWKRTRWAGIGVSFHVNASGGSFVVRGTRGSAGFATGSFKC